MKFNMKNRPEVIEGPVLTKEDGAYDWHATSIIQEVKLIKFTEWFENFEKELRERILDLSCGRKPNRTEYWTIKEILGE